MQIGFVGALALVLITLKLTNYIDWSWLWVLAPLWAPWVVVAFGAVLVAASNLGLRMLETPEQRKRRAVHDSLRAYHDRLTRRG